MNVRLLTISVTRGCEPPPPPPPPPKPDRLDLIIASACFAVSLSSAGLVLAGLASMAPTDCTGSLRRCADEQGARAERLWRRGYSGTLNGLSKANRGADARLSTVFRAYGPHHQSPEHACTALARNCLGVR